MSTQSRGEIYFRTGSSRLRPAHDARSVRTLLRFTKCLFAGFLSLFVICLSLATAEAQQSAFTYQGKLTDGGSAANGNYDLQLALFDSPTVGTQISTTQTLTSVSVSAGIFTVSLDFGANAFTGANRYLEISARPSGVGSFTLLTPRQPISSTPYAVRSVSAASADGLSVTCASCVTSSQIQSVQASQVTGNIPGGQINGTIPVASVPAGSASYIQNSTAPQENSNFNIAGTGVVGGNFGIGTSSPQYKLHVVGQDVRVENDNANRGPRFSWNFSAGSADSKKWQAVARTNSLWFSILDDVEIREFPWLMVNRNQLDFTGVIFPRVKVGIGTAFGKVGIGTSNDPQTTLDVSDFYNPNIRVESAAVGAPTIPRFSLSYGYAAADEKKWQNYASNGVWNFSALNDNENNEDVWLSVSRTGTVIKDVLFPRGIKVTNPTLTRPAFRAETTVAGGTVASFGNLGEFQIDANGIPAGRVNVKENGSVILGDCPGCFPNVTDRLVVSGIARIVNLGSGGSASLCRNASNQISACSSSMRYKTNIADWRSGLNLVNRLRPVTFDWKDSQAHDLGLVAEEVAAAEPLLVTRNEKGEVEGVKYDRLSAVFINAFKEQQTQIEEQQAQIKAQENQIKAQDKALVGLSTRLASLEATMRHPRPRQRKAFQSRR